VGRSVDTVMRVRVPKKRREDFLRGRDELEVVCGGALALPEELSGCLEARTEAILRMLREGEGEEEGRERMN
jgi:hypothetical protein